LGESIALRRRYTGDRDIWSGRLDEDGIVACNTFDLRLGIPLTRCSLVAINLQDSARSITLELADIGLSSANAEDLVSGESIGQIDGS
jgi:alpha-galactosidase